MLERLQHRSGLHGIAMALLLVLVMTVVMIIVRQYVQPTNRSVVYLIPVIAAAVWWGVVPAVVAALAGIVAAVYTFYPPLYSFKIPQTPQMINLGLFLVIALVTGRLATAVRAQAEVARKREREVRELYAFSRRLATARGASDIYAAIQEHLSNLMQRKAVLFEANSTEPVDVGERADQWVPERVHAEVTKYARSEGESESGSIVDDGSGHLWLVRLLVPKTPAFGAIAIDLGRAADSDVEDVRGRIEDVLADAAATFDRLDIARVIDDARMRSDTENLREALIGSVSHELRTPLAAILGSATVLCDTPVVAGDDRLGALAAVIRDEAERLNSDIQNLLDATRISSRSVKPLRQWYDLTDLVNSALERRTWRLSDHAVMVNVAADLPLVYVDPVLMEQALVQILDNVANRDGHMATTAVEIWEQTEGKVDGFVSAVGTGGTLAGVAFGLKAKNRDIKIALADPLGAALYSFYTEGVLKAEGSSITEGIGQGRITANLDGFTPDFSFQIPDEEAVPYVFDLVQEEGLCLGGSTGINIAGAIRLAREMGPGHRIVTILADYGTRYQSKLFNSSFLRTKNLPVPAWMEESSAIDVPFEEVA